MKKITIILTILLSALLNSCTKDFLDQVPDDKLTLEETFSHQSTVENFLANVYSYIPDENRQRFVGSGNSGPWTAGSDEAEYVWSFVQSQNINAGAWDASSDLSSNKWANYYRGIRSAGVFISNVDNCQDCKQALITRFKAEARALRAIYYFNLVKIFGPVVLIDGVIPPDASFDQVQLPRNTLDECIDFVVNELTAAEKIWCSTIRTWLPGHSPGEFQNPSAGRLRYKLCFTLPALYTTGIPITPSSKIPMASS
jgi:hypothetical protein